MGGVQKQKTMWANLSFPEDLVAKLKDLCVQVRQGGMKGAQGGRPSRGMRALFSGPSGTGKIKAAEAIANELRTEVHRVDLSGIVSKYIGETEKNLSRLFDKASEKNWILFFDEADALFGKRTEVRDSHDRYANLEVSYLLQRIESYEGLIILATNHQKNLDEAFTRRLNYVIEFPLPSEEERNELWKNVLPESAPKDERPPKRRKTMGIRGKDA